jgi:hypothetical protein
MDLRTGDVRDGDPAPSGRRLAIFGVLLVGYYGVYYYFFSLRLVEYARDILKHFAFVRRFI